MRRILTTAAVLASLATPALAQTVTPTAWGTMIENISAARFCGLISARQTFAALAGIGTQVFGPQLDVPDAYKAVTRAAFKAGENDAAQPGACDGFSPTVLNAIRETAIDNGAP